MPRRATSGWARPLDGSSRSDDVWTVRHDGGQIHDAPLTGRQVADSQLALFVVTPMVDELVDAGSQVAFVAPLRGCTQHGIGDTDGVDRAITRDRERLLDGQRREQFGVLERAPEPETRTAGERR